jgi:hypothetical protein
MKSLIIGCFVLLLTSSLFSQSLQRYELLITEFMADPLPVVGLPAAEFIELKNISKRPLRLDGCRITDGVTTGILGSGITLPPDSLLILCPKSQLQAFAYHGRSIALNAFPSIDNDGDEIVLISPEGLVIHAVRFEAADYRNPMKQNGGWSFEMIDPRFPCQGTANWAVSVAPEGGTPGRANSVAGNRSDQIAPVPIRSWAVDSLNLVVQFDEGLDSLSASQVKCYNLRSDAPMVVQARPLPPFFDHVSLTLSFPLSAGRVHQLEVKDIRDCHGNQMPDKYVVNTGRSGAVRDDQLRINEILFDPKPGGADYVELINLGPGIIDARNIYLGNATTSGQAASLKPLQTSPRMIFPGEMIVVTTDPAATSRDYAVHDRRWLWKMDNMPSYPDDAGTVVVMDNTGKELDRFEYRADMHFKLLGEKEGVALERIRPSGVTMMSGNWHSASSGSGYGTPTGRNSQYMSSDTLLGQVQLSSKVFSPDLDGIDDVLTISWRFPEPGNIMSLRVLDIQGRLIKMLCRNDLAGTSGDANWNGLSEAGKSISAGPYVIWADVTDRRGKQRLWRLPFIIAYR